jgi:Zn-dependent protease
MEKFDLYPEKPALKEPKESNNMAITAFSIVLFVLTFLFVFSNEVQFIFHLLVVLFIHELGHYVFMKWFNYKNVRMLFIPLMGAFVQGKKDSYSQKESLVVVGAGPFPGIMIGVLLLLLAANLQYAWMVNLAMLFLLLNILNLVPLDPLDGGQLFKLLWRKNHELFSLIFAFVSSLFLIGIGWYMDSWLVMAVGFLMGFRVRSIQNQYHLRKGLRAENVNYITTYEQLTNEEYAKIKASLFEQTPALKSYSEAVPETESNALISSQVNGVLVSPIHRDASFIFKLTVVFLWLAVCLAPFVLWFFYKDLLIGNYEWYFKLL